MLKLVGLHPNSDYNLIMQSNCFLIITLKLKKSISKPVVTEKKKNIPRPNSSLLEHARLLLCCWIKNEPYGTVCFAGFLKYSDVIFLTCWIK